MKKPALFVLGLLLLAFISIYFIIPQYITAKSVVRVDVTDVNAFKFIIKPSSWKKWWPGEHTGTDSTVYTHNGITYTLQKSTNSYIQVQIKKGDDVLNSRITYLAADEGSTDVTWYALQQSSINPFARIAEFIRIKNMQGDMDDILMQFNKFMQNDVNVYGISFKIKKITDHWLITTSSTTKTYPAMETVYGLIENLRKQIASQKAKEIGSPMLNVNQTDNKDYEVMVALPINKAIKPGANTKLIEMVVGGNMLGADVKGGKQTVANAFVQLKNYQKDHGLISPAMPFEILITNRLTEKDTAKWVTKLYWPIF
jgi:effector-binding domain-containing protein